MPMTLTFRPPHTIDEYRSIEWLQAQIWGSKVDIVPLHMLITFAKEGGIVLLMLDNDAPAGFTFGFPALTADGQLKLASHQAGVLPAYQTQGWGHRLKLAQREAALASGYTLITWTFDPLQGRNARLNLRKLGAVCNTYIPNLYGDMVDALNQGLPSDRFRVDWWLKSTHVAQRIGGDFIEPDDWLDLYPVLNPAQPGPNALALPPDSIKPVADDPAYLIEIPNSLSQLKAEQPQVALNWRLQTRQLFFQLFAVGYTAIDLLRSPTNRNFYLLQKGWSME